MTLRTTLERWLRQQWTRRGWWYILCWGLALVFAGVVWLRHRCYALGLCKTTRFNVPVIIIGNISVGGTGKTPLVIWLVNRLKEAGWRVGVVSRGYRGTFQGVQAVYEHSPAELMGDESVLIAKRTQVPVFVCRDRVRAVQALLQAHPQCNVIVSDDGLQHLALGRDVEIVVLGSQVSNGALLPAGDLREPLWRLLSVSALVGKTNAVLAVPQFSMQLQVCGIYQLIAPSIRRTAADFKDEQVLALTGIGNPQRFADSLSQLGLHYVLRVYADHHVFSAQDAKTWQADSIVMSEKDAVKCLPFADARMWVLAVEAEVDAALWTLISNKLNGIQHGQKTTEHSGLPSQQGRADL